MPPASGAMTIGAVACVGCLVLSVAACCMASMAFKNQVTTTVDAIETARGKPYAQVVDEVRASFLMQALTIQVVRRGAGQTLTAGDNTLVLVVDDNDLVTDAIVADEDAVKTIKHAGAVATYLPTQ